MDYWFDTIFNIYKNTVQDTVLKTFAVLFICIKIYFDFGSIIFSALWHHFQSTASVCVCNIIYNIMIICTVLLRHLVSQNHVDKLHLLIEQPEQAAHQTWPRLDDVAQVARVGGLRHISWHITSHMTFSCHAMTSSPEAPSRRNLRSSHHRTRCWNVKIFNV